MYSLWFTIIYPVGRDCKNGGFSNKDLSSSWRKSGICVFEILIFDNYAYHLHESLENSLSSHAYVQCTSK